jgi:adenylate kinase
MKIIMLGAPGAGKGTRAAIIAEHYQIPHISTGDIFRANLKAGTELGLEAKKYMDAGELVPDELTVKILLDRVAQDDCKAGYILDGFPRTIRQAEVLEEALNKINDKVDCAIEVYVPDEVIVERMSGRRVCKACGATYHAKNMPPLKEGVCDKCGGEVVQRADDAPETVRQRLVVYHEQTEPLIDFYEERGILKWNDGTGSPETALLAAQKVLRGL